MLYPLAILAFVLTFADLWTTYLCLRAPVEGWHVVEANPLVEWLFHASGLVGGLLLDSLFTLIVVGFLLVTPHFSRRAKEGFLFFIGVTTGYAVANNLTAISVLGLSPLGIG